MHRLLAKPVLSAILVGSLAVLSGQVEMPKTAATLGSVDHLNVIIQFKSEMGPKQHRQVRKLGGTLYRELPIINGAAYHISKQGLERLLASGIVESYSLDQ